MNSECFVFNLPAPATELNLVIESRLAYQVERGMLLRLEAWTESGDSVGFTSGFCSFSESISSWFMYYPHESPTAIVRPRTIVTESPVDRLRISVQRWSDKEADPADLLVSALLVVDASGVAAHTLAIAGAKETRS